MIKHPKKEETESTTDTAATSQDSEQPHPLQQQVDDLTNTLKRLQAEFENYKKRVDKENAQFLKNANAELIKDILPVLDSFELAIKNSNGNAEITTFKKGLELIYAQLFGILESEGLRPIQTKDQRFDPFKHEVLMVKESEHDDDHILQEFQKGYMFNDTVLRHAKVMISKKAEHTAQAGQ
jgi:molecular chaperone GrpE